MVGHPEIGLGFSYDEEVLNNLASTTQVSILKVMTGTLQDLLESDNNSTLSNIVQSIIDGLLAVARFSRA
ncbi:hypothetical protein N7490_001698 [Penicillium lividum]|nr:hypothetical protein N7490_001698 [Penicillium lividum]